MRKIIYRIISLMLVGLFTVGIAGCTQGATNQPAEVFKEWLANANLEAKDTPSELYQAALEEDTLVIYSVSSRAFEVKEQFEKEYPGLVVEIKDVRGEDVVHMLLSNYENKTFDCDLVICSDCDGSLYEELLQPGIVYAYVPWDIAPKMKEGHADRELRFLGESLMLFYNDRLFDEQPIHNLWELTESSYKGKIMMASPLSSFSTFGFCSTILKESEMLAKAYEDYAGCELMVPEGKSAGEIFLERISGNIIFTNSSDEVLEGVGASGEDGMKIGIMVSSKLRYQELGYHIQPIYRLEPFAAVYTPNSVTIAGGSKNIHAAKLFIRYLIGEADGKGAGFKPFSTAGTWSPRIDVADGNKVPLSEMDYAQMDSEYIYQNADSIRSFWKELLKESVGKE